MPRNTRNLGGTFAPRFRAVVHEFERNFSDRAEVGASFAVFHDGRMVVDLWGGLSHQSRGSPWRQDTIQMIWSGTKGLVAVCILLLIERGVIKLDEPVASYWPEFATEGKQDVLVRHVMSHTAGVPGLSHAVSNEDFANWQLMSDLVAAERPLWSAGSKLYYHSYTYGWICSQLVKRTDGRSLGRFFAEEVAEPLGLELWIGLPEDVEPRTSTMHLWPRWGQGPNLKEDPVQSTVWTGPRLVLGQPLPWNSRTFHEAEIAGANAIGTARSVARLYGCLARGGEIDGFRLLREQSIEIGKKHLAEGWDPATGSPKAYGVGFALQTHSRQFGPVAVAFGHGGAGGSIHGAWPAERIGFSYAMNEMRDELVDARAAALLRALYSALHVDSPSGDSPSRL